MPASLPEAGWATDATGSKAARMNAMIRSFSMTPPLARLGADILRQRVQPESVGLPHRDRHRADLADLAVLDDPGLAGMRPAGHPDLVAILDLAHPCPLNVPRQAAVRPPTGGTPRLRAGHRSGPPPAHAGRPSWWRPPASHHSRPAAAPVRGRGLSRGPPPRPPGGPRPARDSGPRSHGPRRTGSSRPRPER